MQKSPYSCEGSGQSLRKGRQFAIRKSFYMLVRRVILFVVMASFALLALSSAPLPCAPLPSALAQSAPQLATLVIDVWPEYDRPATVLVIYRGQFAPGSPIPQQVKVRMPASAGEPSAVASPQPGNETAPVNQWTELIAQKKVSTTRSGDWIEVTFTPLSRLFNIEFYDKISTVTFDRRYTLTWPGDFTVDAVTVNLREPFGATNFQSTPTLPLGVTDEEGLVAHRLEVGALEAGHSFVFSIGYHREDKRTSAEALQLATPAPTPKPTPLPVAKEATPWLLIAAIGVGLVLIIGGIVWYVRSQQAQTFRPYQPPALRKGRRSVRTSRAPRTRPRPAATLTVEATETATGFCTQCGKPLQPDDTFCSRCGTRVKGK
jgi:hypothetical protein